MQNSISLFRTVREKDSIRLNVFFLLDVQILPSLFIDKKNTHNIPNMISSRPYFHAHFRSRLFMSTEETQREFSVIWSYFRKT